MMATGFVKLGAEKTSLDHARLFVWVSLGSLMSHEGLFIVPDLGPMLEIYWPRQNDYKICPNEYSTEPHLYKTYMTRDADRV